MNRYAIIAGARTRQELEAYLPENYSIALELENDEYVIGGVDNAGWTLEAYVLPRLASGLIFGRELSLDEYEELEAASYA
jgi:hypothetical protein